MEALERALSGEGLTLSTIPGKGRGLIADKDFLPGDAVICQEPYVSSPSITPTGSWCDGCFASVNLKKCSRCRIAWYCGSACQKSEWKLHQLECQAISSLSADRKNMLTPTLRLMIRLVLRRKLQNEQIIQKTATDNYDLVAALVSRIQQFFCILPDLSCNAHSICDDELRPLGTGLYPVISIINHSCLPNSVLAFDGRIALVRAVQPIHKGDEVLISYIETAATTKMRQDYLKQYFFACSCLCCTKNPLEELKEDAILEGYRCKDQKCYGFLFYETKKKIFTCQVCGLSRDEHEISRIVEEVEKISTKAASFSCADNILH